MKLTGVILVNCQDNREEMSENERTDSIRAKVITREAVHLGELATMNGPEVEVILLALPH